MRLFWYKGNGIKEKAYMYSDWEAAGRYDLHFSVRTDSVERALRLEESWIKEIEPEVPKRCRK